MKSRRKKNKKPAKSRVIKKTGLQTEKRYLSILKELPDIVYKIDQDGHFTFINNAIGILGYKPKDLIGKHFSKIVHPDDVKLFSRHFVLRRYKGKATGDEKAPKLIDERRTGKRKTENLEIRLIPKKNRNKETESIIGAVIAFGDLSSAGYYDTCVTKSERKFLGTLGIIRDITKIKQDEKKLHYQADLLQNVSDAIISTDMDFKIRTWNKAAEKMYGWKAHEVIDKPMHKVTKVEYLDGETGKNIYKKLSKKGYWTGVVTERHKDGKAIIINKSMAQIIDTSGNIIGTVTVNRDITNIRHAEQKLRESEEKYRNIVESAPDGIITVDGKGIITSVNASFCKRTGYFKEDIIGKHISKMPSARLEDIPKYIKIFSALLRGKVPKAFEFRWVHKDKSVHWGEVHVSRMKVDGKIVGYQAITRDITERKANEEARRLSDEKLSLAVEAAGLGLWDQDFKTNKVYRNEQWAKMLGYTVKEIETHPKAWLEFIHPDDLQRVKNLVRKHEKGNVPIFDVEHRMRTRNGHWKWVQNWGKIIERDKNGKPLRALGVHRDITERKNAEQIQSVLYKIAEAVYTTANLGELVKSIQKQLSKIINATNFYIALYNKKSNTLSFPYFIDGKRRLTNVSAGRSLTSYVIKHNRPLLLTKEIRKKLLKTGEALEIGTPSKSWLGVPLKIREEVIGAAAVLSYSNDTLYTEKDVHILQFVSNQIAIALQRKQTEELLKASEEKHRELINNSIDGIIAVDSQMKITLWNPGAQRIFGYTEKEIMGRSLLKIVPAGLKKAKMKGFDRLSKTGMSSIAGKTLELIGLRKNGTEIPVELTVSIRKTGKEFVATAIVRDITERKQTEETLKQSEKDYRDLFNNATDAIYIQDKEGRFLDVNQGALDMYGYPKEFFMGKTPEFLSAPGKNDMKKILGFVEDAFNNKSRQYDFWGIRKNGEVFPEIVRSQQGFYIDQKVIITFAIDITERKRTEESLKKSSREWQITFDSTSDLIFLQDTNHNIIRANQTTAKFIGLPMEKIIGHKCYRLLHGKESPPDVCPFRRTKKSKKHEEAELYISKKDIWIQASVDPILDAKGNLSGAVHIIQNITNRKKAEIDLKNSLNEKEALLKEVHHRVKNNLQIISSLLNLQAEQITDKHYREIFKESQNRIKSMGLVHEKLYRSKDLTAINVRDYINGLLQYLCNSYGVEQNGIAIKTDIEDIALNIDTAIPCGLIINELVSNSLKHAFVEPSRDSRAEITIKLHLVRKNKTVLIVSDNGTGFPNSLDFKKTKSLGMQLVCTLTEQLSGDIKITRGKGTTFTITFKKGN